MAVPSHGFRATLVELADQVRPWIPIVSLSKGLEPESRLRMSEPGGDGQLTLANP